MSMVNVALMYFVSYFSIIVFFMIIPFVSRKNVSFGISIPTEVFDVPEVKKIRKQYLLVGIILGVAIFLVSILLSNIIDMKGIQELIIFPAMMLLLAAYSVLYLVAYRKMKNLKAGSDWKNQASDILVVDTSFRTRKHLVSPWWFLTYLVVILATLAIGFIFYNQMPDKIPMKYDLNGNVLRTMDKSQRIVLFGPLVQIFLSIVFLFSFWMIGKSKTQIDAANPEVSGEQNRKFRYRWSAFLLFMGLGMLLMFGFMQLSFLGIIKDLSLVATVPMVLVAILVLAVIILSVKTGQSGSRIQVQTTKDGQKTTIVRDDDRFWKLGSIYYNPQDPALFVEKRFGIGWTVNFGRPASWLILIGFLALTAAFCIFTTLFMQ